MTCQLDMFDCSLKSRDTSSVSSKPSRERQPPLSQTQIILALLKKGPVTVPLARKAAKCERLAARINDLRRAGHQIETEHRRLPNGKVIAAYHLKEIQWHQ